MIIQNSDIIDDSDYFLTLINGYGNDERVRRLRELLIVILLLEMRIFLIDMVLILFIVLWLLKGRIV